MNKQELKEAVGELNFVNTVFEADGVSYIDTAVSVTQVYDLIDQLDEPEKVTIPQFVAEAFERAKGGNWFAEQLINAMYDSSDEVGYWLEVPSNEKLLLRAWLDGYKVDKVVIPQFVADWWEGDSVTMYGGESINKKYKFRLISEFHDRGLGDYLSKVEDWLDENDSAFLDLVNGKPYEIEKEKLYVVELSNSNGRFGKYENVFLNKRDGIVFIDSSRLFVNDIKKYRQYALTEKEIKDYDERYWPFAVEVAE